ncbi:MAG: hypothetical protein ACO3N7_08155 [Kiritimatiellia bacterium]
MKKCVITICLLLSVSGTMLPGEMARYSLGRIDLAGMVPGQMPAPGSSLILENPELPVLADPSGAVGFIPTRYREALRRMQAAGLQLELEVLHSYAAPLPGKFLMVEIWVTTEKVEALHPLIYAVPVNGESPEMARLD